MADKEKFAGSAETGGEKAAPQITAIPQGTYRILVPDPARDWKVLYKSAAKRADDYYEIIQELDKLLTTFRSSSQNQTVSSGVEGAHEGTTADESDSREPEKLNNAHKSTNCTKCGRPILTATSTVASGMMRDLPQYFCTCVALVESSLSSPPPKICPHFTDNRLASDCGICDDASPELLPTQLPPDE